MRASYCYRGLVSDYNSLDFADRASDPRAGVIVTVADELPTDQGSLEPVDVLLVEDDPGDALMTREAFEQRGMRNRLHVVSDGEQAIEFLRRAGDYTAAPTPGLILLDLNLPRRSGLDVLTEVKSDSELLRIPIVVLTTSHAQQDIVRSYSLHANAYVTKPIDFDRFMNTIGQIDDFYLTLVKLPNGMTSDPPQS